MIDLVGLDYVLPFLLVVAVAGRRRAAPLAVLPEDLSRNPVGFIETHLVYNEKGERWQLSPHQRQLLKLIFVWLPVAGCAARACVTGCVGHLVLRLLLWGEMKKSGKSFLAACLVLWWSFTRAATEVILAANDLEQIQGRIFKTCVALLKHNPALGRSAKVTGTEIRLSNGTVITAIASDYKGAAGSRHSLYVIDEPWGITEERGERLVEELTPPPTEVDAWGLMVTTAGWVGESKPLETVYRRGLTGERLDPDLELYRTHELTMFWSHRPRQAWQDQRYYDSQRRSLRPATFARLHENRWVTAESTIIPAKLWDGNVDGDLQPARASKVTVIYMGVDAAVKWDCSAVVAITGSLAAGWRLVRHRIWTPRAGAPLDLEATILQAVFEWAHQFTIGAIYADPSQMLALLAKLRQAGLPAHEYPQTSANLTRMAEVLLGHLREGTLTVYPDDELRQHALNTVGIESPRGLRIAKTTASRKIDGIIALGMALVAGVEAADAIVITEEDQREMAWQEAQVMRRLGFEVPREPWGGWQNVVGPDWTPTNVIEVETFGYASREWWPR